MNCLIICGDHPRNYFFVKKLLQIEYLKISNILLYKRENVFPSPPSDLRSDLKKLWSIHFEKRNSSESKLFNFNLRESLDDKIISINSTSDMLKNEIAEKIKKENIDICFISGIPILSRNLLKLLPSFTINLHLGLIPHYKGSITMFWPFLFLEHSMDGTTYHVIDNWVDTGEILHNQWMNSIFSSKCISFQYFKPFVIHLLLVTVSVFGNWLQHSLDPVLSIF